MTDLRQAAQQALEAMETNKYTVAELAPHKVVMKFNDAITALREALAQEHALHDLARLGQEIEQGPVAWRDPTNIDPGQGCTYTKERHMKWPHIYRQALYTAPPAAKRKPLTANEILNLMPSSIPAEYDGPLMEFAIAIEAKLKEKTDD